MFAIRSKIIQNVENEIIEDLGLYSSKRDSQRQNKIKFSVSWDSLREIWLLNDEKNNVTIFFLFIVDVRLALLLQNSQLPRVRW